MSNTTRNMRKSFTLLEKLDIPHIYCPDHVLQLTTKNDYLASWYNRSVPGVANDAEDTNLDEVVELFTMANVQSLMEYLLRSNQELGNLKEQQTRMQYYMGNKEVGALVNVVTHWWSTFSMR